RVKVMIAVIQAGGLIADNPAQQRRVPRIEQLIAERAAIMQENARRRAIGGIEVASARAASGIGQQASAKIYDLTGEMKQEELRLLELRRVDEQLRQKQTLIVLFNAAWIIATTMIPGY